jgi:hypothetical protein
MRVVRQGLVLEARKYDSTKIFKICIFVTNCIANCASHNFQYNMQY